MLEGNKMTKHEQKLMDAAREILSDFNQYGEVLQTGDNGEYGMDSAIGRLNSAIVACDNQELCDNCPYLSDEGICCSPLGCLNEGVTDER